MNIGDIRNHMISVRQTVKISSAQKLIAGARIVKARKMFEQSQSYHDRIRRAAASILGDCETKSKYFDRGDESKKRGLLVISADKGLAGGYNHNVLKLAQETLGEHPAVKLLAAGHSGFRKFQKTDRRLDSDFRHSVENPTIYTAREMAEQMIEMFENGEVDCFDIIYTHYRSAAQMVPTLERLFPLTPGALGEPVVHFVEYEPSPDAVLDTLIPKYIKGFLFGCLVQAWICELSSRISAMDSAIKNGNEMLGKLELRYNQLRQGAITSEITEIVAGASSMSEE